MVDLYRSTPKQDVPTREQIAHRAYELYEQRGCEPGRETEDWLAAERELRNQNLSSTRPSSAEKPDTLTGSRQRQPKAKAAAAFDSSKSFDDSKSFDRSKSTDSNSKEF